MLRHAFEPYVPKRARPAWSHKLEAGGLRSRFRLQDGLKVGLEAA